MSNKILAGNVPLGVDDKKIAEFFSTVGNVVSISIPTKGNGKPCGFAIVELENHAQVERALAKLKYCELEGRSISLTAVNGEKKVSGSFLMNWIRLLTKTS